MQSQHHPVEESVSGMLLHLQNLIHTSISHVQPEDTAEDYVEILRFMASELGVVRARLNELALAL